MFSFDCGCNLFQRPDVFVVVLETLDSVYGCSKFSFLRCFLFKQLSLVVSFVFEVANDFSHSVRLNIILYASRLVCKVVYFYCL